MIWKTTMLSKSLKWQFQNNQMTPERIVLFELRRGNACTGLKLIHYIHPDFLPLGKSRDKLLFSKKVV